MKTTSLKSFHYLENGEVSFSIMDTVKTEKKMDAGVYNISYQPYPIDRNVITQIKNEKPHKIFNFTDKDKIDSLLKSFFCDETVLKINELGFLHKVGFLFYGKEGTGKTSIAKHYYNIGIQNHNAIVFYVNTYNYLFIKCWEFISEIRKIQDNPIYVILEEFDGYIKENVNQLKSILDGNLSISNCIFFASTNHIDEIPKEIKNRESRFKFVINIEGIQNKSEVFEIVNTMLQKTCTPENITEYTDELTGKTLDEIKQFCLDKIMSLSPNLKSRKTLGFVASN